MGATRGRIAVAMSGGRDSTALLHATARAAHGSGLQVHALHVHHGLVEEADAWVEQLRRQCLRWQRAGLPVQLHVQRLQTQPRKGDSIEAWARRERYRALAEMALAAGAGTVLLAHHRQDQAETLLLQALRGAGAAGLAAMPAAAVHSGVHWLRPWLAHPRSAIDAYVRRHRLSFVDDASNADPRYARNRLRLSVWPALVAAFPDAEQGLAAAAQRAHEAAECSAALAAIDCAACVDAQGCVQVAAWQRLGAARRANVLRAWLGERLKDGPQTGVPDSLVQRLVSELAPGRQRGATTASWPSPAGPLRLYRGLLHGPAHESMPLGNNNLTIDMSRTGIYPLLPWHGAFDVTPAAAGQGIPARLLATAELRPRTGSETFQRSARSTARSLKKQFQAAGVPAWQRSGPLVYASEQLLYVPGLGVDARVQSHGNEASLALHWRRDVAS